MAITYKTWEKAQKAEAEQHKHPEGKLLSIYQDSYRQYFEYVDIKPNQQGKKIIEVGCAHVPALFYCYQYKGTIIEPMPSELLQKLTSHMNATVLKEPAEYVDLEIHDEVWLFNVLQHVIDPDLLVQNMKRSAKRIRYFEPIDTEITDYHPHSFTMDDFKEWFKNPELYEPEGKIINFHTNQCAYGVYDNV